MGHGEASGILTVRIAATSILNDDVDGAEQGLAQGSSSFHNVCAVFSINPAALR